MGTPDPSLWPRLLESISSLAAAVLMDDESELSPHSQRALEQILVSLDQLRGEEGH